MKIYTTYFARVSKLPEHIIPISIAAKTPDQKMNTYKKLAPPWYVLKAYKDNQNEEEYIKEYKRLVLSQLKPDDVVKAFANMISTSGIPDDLDVALVCYEKAGSFCHRNLVAEWLNEAGYDVKEWRP